MLLRDEALQPYTKWALYAVLVPIIKLIDNTPCGNAQYWAEDNPIHFNIKNEVPETLLLIKQEKSRDIECKSKERKDENPRTQKQTDELRKSV